MTKRRNKREVKPVRCPYCDSVARLVKGNEIYPHRKDLAYLNFYLCDGTHFRPHERAYVGTHKGTIIPLGRLANEELRKAKSQAHRVFDRIWREGHLSRPQAYAWLSKQLGLTPAMTHIGMFTVERCQEVERLARNYMAAIEFGD